MPFHYFTLWYKCKYCHLVFSRKERAREHCDQCTACQEGLLPKDNLAESLGSSRSSSTGEDGHSTTEGQDTSEDTYFEELCLPDSMVALKKLSRHIANKYFAMARKKRKRMEEDGEEEVTIQVEEDVEEEEEEEEGNTSFDSVKRIFVGSISLDDNPTNNPHLDDTSDLFRPLSPISFDFEEDPQGMDYSEDSTLDHSYDFTVPSMNPSPPGSVSSTISPSQAWQCPKCPHILSNCSQFDRHMEAHGEGFVCLHCNAGFKTRQTLRRHIQVLHSGLPVVYLSRAAPLTDPRTSPGPDALIDTSETMSSSNPNTKQENIKRRLKKKRKIVRVDCKICDLSLMKQSLKRHMQTVHAGNRLRPFVCQKCGQRFYAIGHSNRHESCCKGVRRNEQDNASTNDEMMQNSLEDQDQDMQIDSIDQPQSFTCHKCEQEFYAIRDWQEHELGCHGISKVKDKEKSLPTDLQKCHLCPESFSSKYSLKRHLSGHGSNFSCPTCGASFNAKSTVWDHRRRAHPEQHEFRRKYTNTKSIDEDESLSEKGVRESPPPPGPSGSPRSTERRHGGVDKPDANEEEAYKTWSPSYPFSCSKCSSGFAEMLELRKHIQVCAPSPMKEKMGNDNVDSTLLMNCLP